MTPQEIRKTLIDRNTSAADIARDLDVSRSMVCHVIKWRRATPVVRRGIARALALPYEMVWGEKDPGIDQLRKVNTLTRTVPAQTPDRKVNG